MATFNTTSTCLQQSARQQSLKSPPRPTTRMVQDLNNKACVLVAMGDFAKANHLLSLALEKHKRAVEECYRMDESEFDEHTDVLSMTTSSTGLEYENYNNSTQHEDYMMDNSSNDSYDSYYDCPRNQVQRTIDTLPPNCFLRPVASGCELSKMTRCNHVHTMPYAGQQCSTSSRNPGNYTYQQVYSLLIVMDATEWESSTSDDQSFVLVFNSALCNHLWGMKLMTLVGKESHTGPFETAKALYLLALETLWSPGSSAGFHGGRIRSVDKLCVPAIFNNLSHVCKVLHGAASQESSAWETVLLKSVYWWIDGNSSVYASTSSSADFNLRRASDGDAEVIDAFLETAFHLIGDYNSVTPAAAA